MPNIMLGRYDVQVRVVETQTTSVLTTMKKKKKKKKRKKKKKMMMMMMISIHVFSTVIFGGRIGEDIVYTYIIT